ncbi:unnamed protein product [Penicillium olsonii]|uniref:FAD dependent oxidoreductase domain-containing protein n=1 Tax=Penicillium olsonii TaxID=99116 RepID=A0A9W4HMX5_PENOL|nr:unnamed protein product [Penicillium olsonii]CAG8063790.1 unnamed protein product [Penicillium olsonii]CAG8284013.1 unnamed protein product [Penicillium olsonii]
MNDRRLFVNSGMLRVQPSDHLAKLEKETLDSMQRDGLRDTQFVKSNLTDCERAENLGWKNKLLDFEIPESPGKSYEAVLDSLAGFLRCSNACAHYREVAVAKGVKFHLGSERGAVETLIKVASSIDPKKMKVTGLKTKDGVIHEADTVVVAAGSFSTQILPDLSYHLESSAGSLATFKIDPGITDLWEKYSPERFPVMTWKSTPRDKSGKDTGSIYVLPRTPEGLVKIGYRGIKWTNFHPAPSDAPFSQDGQWSTPLPLDECSILPEPALHAVSQFVSIFMPEFVNAPFYSTKLCWYTDSLDNSFVHAADILENGDKSSSFMRPFWRWRPDAPRRNGLEEGPGGPRDIGHA